MALEHLDSFDQRILSLMQTDSRRTGEQLSELVGLSPAACLRRVQRLRQSGVIEREIAILSPSLREQGTTIFVLMAFEKHNPRVMDVFCHKLRKRKEVVRLNWVTGEDDAVLIVNCPTMTEFSRFCEAFLDHEPVSGYRSFVSMREYDTTETD